jgi:predicted nucleic acid-binding protein
MRRVVWRNLQNFPDLTDRQPQPSPLYASIDRRDDDYERSLAVMERSDLHLVIPALLIAEVCYLAGSRMGSRVESAFLRGLSEFDVEALSVADWIRMAELVDQYANFPLSGTDASVIALAERLGADLIVTLDTRHFAAIRPRHRPTLRLIPE